MNHLKKDKTPWYLQVATISISALAGLISAIVSWRIFRYFRDILRQPPLRYREISFEGHDLSNSKFLGFQIAAANLRAGIEKRGLPDGSEKLVLCAGRRNFREPWGRDLGFASYGMVELGEYQAVKESLEVFLINQLPSGQFPIKVGSTRTLDRFFHALLRREQPIVSPLKPKYVSGHNTVSLDSNALLVIALLNYVDRSGDDALAERHWGSLQRAMGWFDAFILDQDGLLQQGAYADWADSIARTGRVLYTNIVYWKALKEMAAFAERTAKSEKAGFYGQKAAGVGGAIQAHFWRADLGYYVTSEDYDNLSSSGNLMAIAWGLAGAQKAGSILDAMDRFAMADPVPTKPVFPPYPRSSVAIENRLGRLAYYHNNAAWLWLGAWHVIALCRVGRLDQAQALLDRISSIIVRDGTVHEVYNPRGDYVSGLWYTSEAPFTWSAGMVVYAHQVYLRRKESRPVLDQVR